MRHLCLGPSRLSLTSLGVGGDRVARAVTAPEVFSRSSSAALLGQTPAPRGPFARSSSSSSMTSQPSYAPTASMTSLSACAPPPMVQAPGGSLRAEPGGSARSPTSERGRRTTSPGSPRQRSPSHNRQCSPSHNHSSPCTPRWAESVAVLTQDAALPRGPERFYYDTTTYTGCARYGGPTIRDHSVGRGSPKWKKELRGEPATLCRKGRANTVLSFSFAGNAPPPISASGGGSLRAPPGCTGDRLHRKASFR